MTEKGAPLGAPFLRCVHRLINRICFSRSEMRSISTLNTVLVARALGNIGCARLPIFKPTADVSWGQRRVNAGGNP
jgi:hypothetical protein